MTSDQITITLTGRRPVRITKSAWPVIATAGDEQHDGKVRCQANRTSYWEIKVRQHADGRVIVYAYYRYDTAIQDEKNISIHHGEILNGTPNMDQVAAAICRVTIYMKSEKHCEGDTDQWTTLCRECIADLPAEDLTDEVTAQSP